jgi:hypothetical protein
MKESTLKVIAIIIAFILMVIIGVVVSNYWWNNRTWTTVTFSQDQKMQITSPSGNVNDLMFKNCIFTIIDPAKKKTDYDVTKSWTKMAKGFSNSETIVSKLTPPIALNAHSFKIKGVNDEAQELTKALGYTAELSVTYSSIVKP